MIPIGVEVKRVIRDTGKSFLVSTEAGQIWLPKFAVEDAGLFKCNDRDIQMYVQWEFAKENGLLKF
jgi:hypothetical protein